MRKITLNSNSELVKILECGKEEQLDYGVIGNSKFVDDVSEEYSRYSKKMDYSNEIFIQFFVKKMEWKHLLNSSDKLIQSPLNNIDSSIWNELVEKNKLQRSNSSRCFSKFYDYSKMALFFVLMFLVVMFKFSHKPRMKLKNNKKIAIVRSSATFTKLNSIKNRFSITLISEDIIYKNSELPSIFSYVHPIAFLKRLPFILSSIYKDYRDLDNEIRLFFGARTRKLILEHYTSRVVIKCYYEELLYCLLSDSNIERLYTGNKEDRFAMVDKKISSSQSSFLTCIPHGLEYSYRFPSGIAGDIFYCTSEASKACLSHLYKGTLFIFDADIQSEIYKISNDSMESKNKEIVFFTESRDIEVNRKIIKDLQSMRVNFSVRLHPKDSKANYLDKSIIFEIDYSNAITNKICLARKSTVLVEALYNSSISVCYLINSKDRFYASYVFPSLNDETIFTCDDKLTLSSLLENIYKV